jgi:hypothetical protein
MTTLLATAHLLDQAFSAKKIERLVDLPHLDPPGGAEQVVEPLLDAVAMVDAVAQ